MSFGRAVVIITHQLAQPSAPDVIRASSRQVDVLSHTLAVGIITHQLAQPSAPDVIRASSKQGDVLGELQARGCA